MSKKNFKYLLGAGLVFYGYLYTYNNSKNVHLTNKHNLLVYLQLNTEQTALLNKQIANFTNKNLTSQIQDSDSILENINKNTSRVKLNLNLHKDINHNDHFAEISSDWVKINKEKWKPDFMNIKFRIDENWFKFYDDIKIDPIDQNFKLNFEQLKSSNLIHESEDLINSVANEPYILKALEILINDKSKLETLGTPICFSFLYFNSYDRDNKLAKIRVEGQLKNADFYISMERGQFENLSLVYDLDERLFSKRILPIIKNDPFELIKKRSNSKECFEIFKQIDLNRIIEAKVKNDNRTVNTLGEPIEFKYEIDEKFDVVNSSELAIKVYADGRLNRAELIINIQKDAQKWKVVDTKFKILWNSTN
ncbi:unnamed protein product [Brachionus calyciflorus]|uniref:Uncharacterized protein n=1 Tax=Brachionus calyciflorus TaxID=104777 RepID=A0A814L9L7_9BILA|nr:unnamed protein product [Brachionus calyciflorus]